MTQIFNFNAKNSILCIITLTILFSSCATIKVDRIEHNEDKQLYEYPVTVNQSILLRNEGNELITKSNLDSFILELESIENKYPFKERLEQAESLKKTDYEIATLYSNAVDNIKGQQYNAALEKIKGVKTLYPDAINYSDCSFLEAYTFQKMGNQKKASEKYNEYLNFSSGKYSERFRGYRNTNLNDTIWLQQRKYAKNYLSGQSPKFHNCFLQQITPKFYYNSLQPGYSLNPEDNEESTKHIIMFVFGMDQFSNDFAGGIQYYRSLNKYFDINSLYLTSGDNREVGLAIPIQAYKSEDNRFAIKISPFLQLTNIENLYFEGSELEMDEDIFNYGIKASAGYFFIPKLSIGAYYYYHRYNKHNHYSLESHPIDIWYDNEYDISLYYNLFKGFSLKSGIKAGDFVAGFYWSGWEMSYNISDGDFVLRVAMY